MNPSHASQPDEKTLARWIQAYLDGRLAGEELQIFEQWLRQDAQHRQRLYEVCRDGVLLMEILQGGGFAAAGGEPVKKRPQPTLTLSMVVMAVAAVLLVLIATLGTRLRRPIGMVTWAEETMWSEGREVSMGFLLTRGTYDLSQGIVRYETQQGTVITIAGPARFQLLSPTAIHLDHGKLGVQMGAATDVFTVRTPHMDVVDRGTAFGVQAHANGAASVTVFDGSVQVQSKQTQPFLLKQGDAASVMPSGRITPKAFNAQDYAELWPLTKGIDQMSHLVEFITPGPQRVLADYRDDQKLFLIPERMHVRLNHALQVDLTPQTAALPLAERQPVQLQDQTVSCYSVFFNAEEPRTWEQPRHIRGQITFSKPILGVIYNDDHLNLSDPFLGLSEITYLKAFGRGLGPQTKNKPGDVITIGPDQRTINFDLYTAEYMDQFRVVVAVD